MLIFKAGQSSPVGIILPSATSHSSFFMAVILVYHCILRTGPGITRSEPAVFNLQNHPTAKSKTLLHVTHIMTSSTGRREYRTYKGLESFVP